MTPSADPSGLNVTRPATRVQGHESVCLSEGWQLACTPPDAAQVHQLDGLEWIAASVPGTAAGALAAARRWRPGDTYDFDAQDWWFRTSFTAAPTVEGEEQWLCLDGLATIAEVHLNGEPLLESDSMFSRHRVDVSGLLRAENILTIRFRALAPLLEASRKPRARWRTQLVDKGNLRFFRTMLLGRAPGFAPGPAAVGPWRDVRLELVRDVVVESLAKQARLVGGDGVLRIDARVRLLDDRMRPSTASVRLEGPSGSHSAGLNVTFERDTNLLVISGRLTVTDVARWWPHTHGSPALHQVQVVLDAPQGSIAIDAGHVGFRELSFGRDAQHDFERDGLDIHVNGVSVFVRGAVWTPRDIVTMAPSAAELRRTLELVRDAGMNILRIPGTAAYESPAFHDLCDELGILVWQDFMFANFDYPTSDEAFLAGVRHECAGVLQEIGRRPSVAVLCGNSEVEQQVAMLGLDPALGRSEWFASELPQLVRDSGTDAFYVTSAPSGGELPFRPDRGVANYYGVGGYRRPLDDARRANVLFAAECLAFSNVPDQEAIDALLGAAHPHPAVHDPAWKAGIPRDKGSGWDFEDVRDHYLRELFDVDAAQLRRVDQARYLELSRAVTGIVMAETFGEWRSTSSSCRGALVLWLADLLPGAGWGLLDHSSQPKTAYHRLARALAPVAVWSTDEGLGGVVIHAANDRPTPLSAQLRIALYSDFQRPVGEALHDVELDAHGHGSWNLETLLGRFVDASWAYRFGPPAQDAIVVSLSARDHDHGRGDDHGDGGEHSHGHGDPHSRLLSQTMRFPAGYPLSPELPERLGLQGSAAPLPDGSAQLTLSSKRVAFGVRLHVPGYTPAEDCLDLEPGVARTVTLRPQTVTDETQGSDSLRSGRLSALNMSGQVKIDVAGES